MTIIDSLREMESHLTRATKHIREAISELEFVETSPEKRKNTVVFSKKEIEILKLLESGLSTEEIGKQLGRSRKTIEAHRDIMRKKLGVAKSHEIVQAAKDAGMI